MVGGVSSGAKVKICGLTRLADIVAVNAARPDFIGFVFAPSRRQVSHEKAAELRAALAQGICAVGVFVDARIEEIVALVRGGVIDAVQLHGREDEKYILELKKRAKRAMGTGEMCRGRGVLSKPDAVARRGHVSELARSLEAGCSFHAHEKNESASVTRRLIFSAPNSVPIIKAVSVQKAGDAQAWQNSAADFLLLDHKGGGTGEAFDWGLIGEVQKPFFLAGGLTPENVADAIAAVGPFAVDVSSGVEASPGVKCAEKIKRFVGGENY
ncbi:MAG: phosphoribosylanthranilate isomerase [Defluviitaleaceae bacterium]|nr:phosphoribosylanthranilate isomerase [Defluviitaleaceae bacterium]